MPMFEQATRLKLRFPTPKGDLMVEDLWDLPLTSSTKPSLDGVAKTLFRQLKSDEDVSFVEPTRKSDSTLQLSFDIVKHVIDVRLAENAAAAAAKANKEKRQLILSVIAQKENEQLLGSSMDDLKKMLETL